MIDIIKSGLALQAAQLNRLLAVDDDVLITLRDGTRIGAQLEIYGRIDGNEVDDATVFLVVGNDRMQTEAGAFWEHMTTCALDDERDRLYALHVDSQIDEMKEAG